MATKREQQSVVKSTCDRVRNAPWVAVQERQRISTRNRPAKGGIWISWTKFTAPPENDLRDRLYEVIDKLKRSDHIITPAASIAIEDVPVEFLGVRHGVPSDAPEPSISEDEKLKALESECQSDMTILFVHGGGMYASSPEEYRAVTTRLAKLTKARIASTSYRLSPQNTFPAPVLDVLLAYASLLYPPPGAPYKACPPEKIVLAGNSAGATLVFALTKFLIEGQKRATSTNPLKFHGNSIGASLPLPAGIATVCGWCDPCDALPSWHSNGANDFLTFLQPACMPGFPVDAAWPTDPPREHPYCRAVTLDHELVCAAAVQDWSGAPPAWFSVGCEERGLDGNKVTASQMAKSGVDVEWNEYEGMTHEFLIMTSKLPQAKLTFERWAEACLALVNGIHNDQSHTKKQKATRWLMPDSRPVDLGSPADLAPLPHAVAREKMRGYNATRPIWTGKLHVAKL